MCRSPFGQWIESGLAGGRVEARAHKAGWDEGEWTGVVASMPVVRNSGRRSSRSLRQDELSSPGVTQSIDLAVVLDLHHCAGSEQVDARNSSHSCMERDARCRGRGRWRAVKERRVRSGIARSAPVHVQAAETVAAMSKPRVLSI